MKQIKRQIGYSIAAVTIMLGLAVVPVSADHGGGSDDVSADSTTTTSTSDSGSQTDSGSRHGGKFATDSSSLTENENDDSTGDGSQQNGKLRSEAALLLKQDRQKGKQHSEVQRQQACEKRQANINKHEAQFSAQAAKHLDTFNSIFTKLQAFHDSKALNVTDYTALVADATAKQTAAQSAVDALKAVDVNIDCTQPDPASTVATIKTAVKGARTALQDYRTSLKNLVVALKGASTAQTGMQSTDNTTQTTGGTQ